MRTFLLLVLLLATGITGFSQKHYSGKKATISFTDQSGDKMKEDAADLLIAITKVSDTLVRKDVYRADGPLQISQSFKSKEMDTPHGRTVEYKRNGLADQFGDYVEGKKEGEWLLVNDSGRIYKKEIFANGKLVKAEDIEKYSGDSSMPIGDEFESEFTGGIQAWTNYLQNNLDYPKKAIKYNVMGTVQVFFKVDTEGSVKDPFPFRSVYYYIDQEALRLIENSPKWKPAFQQGKAVSSYKLQPIGFRFSE